MTRPSFGVQVFIGMALGLVLGFVARSYDLTGLTDALRIVGEMFVQLLKALVVPLVFTAIVASIAALRDLNNAAKLVASTFVWFGITALIAVSIGLTLGIVLQQIGRAHV